jgi:glycosyltransferase involved in cell wall biosynthesis
LTGYVPNEDMVPLYAAARRLVFLTFFGPTNIPILEAWAHGCPVLTSDIRGMQEQWAVRCCWRIRGPWRRWRRA